MHAYGDVKAELRRSPSEDLKNSLPYIAVFFLVVGLAGVLFLWRIVDAMVREPRAKGRLKETLGLLGIGVVALVVWLLIAGASGACLLYRYESDVNEDFHSLPRSFVSTLEYISPFFPGQEPVTREGQKWLRRMSWVSLALLGAFFTPLLRKVLQAEVHMYLDSWKTGSVPKGWKDHIVILNRNSYTDSVVRQLQSSDLHSQRCIAVVAHGEFHFDHKDKRVRFIPGDPSEEECLNQAAVGRAHSVIILSAWQPADSSESGKKVDADAADKKTISTIRTIRSLCAKQDSPRVVRITAEIRAKKNREAAEKAGDGGEIEIICAGEIYRSEVPEGCVGKTFGKLLEYLAQLRESDGKWIIPIGVYRAPKLYLNPRDDDVGDLKPDDFIFVASEDQPRWPVRAKENEPPRSPSEGRREL